VTEAKTRVEGLGRGRVGKEVEWGWWGDNGVKGDIGKGGGRVKGGRKREGGREGEKRIRGGGGRLGIHFFLCFPQSLQGRGEERGERIVQTGVAARGERGKKLANFHAFHLLTEGEGRKREKGEGRSHGKKEKRRESQLGVVPVSTTSAHFPKR